MTAAPKKNSLSQARRRLIEAMTGIGFGRIEGLAVKQGEPLLVPATRVFREVTLGKALQAEAAPHGEDFLLKKEVLDLLDCLDQIGNGTVTKLEIRHGLPFRLQLEERVALDPEEL